MITLPNYHKGQGLFPTEGGGIAVLDAHPNPDDNWKAGETTYVIRKGHVCAAKIPFLATLHDKRTDDVMGYLISNGVLVDSCHANSSAYERLLLPVTNFYLGGGLHNAGVQTAVVGGLSCIWLCEGDGIAWSVVYCRTPILDIADLYEI